MELISNYYRVRRIDPTMDRHPTSYEMHNADLIVVTYYDIKHNKTLYYIYKDRYNDSDVIMPLCHARKRVHGDGYKNVIIFNYNYLSWEMKEEIVKLVNDWFNHPSTDISI
jgi:hypothetical protein